MQARNDIGWFVKNATLDEIKNIPDLANWVNSDDMYHNTPLGLAVRYNKLDVAKFLIEQGAKTFIPGQFIEPLAQISVCLEAGYAAAEGDINDADIINMMKLFLNDGPNVNANINRALNVYNSHTMLFKAIEMNRPKVVEFLLNAGANTTLQSELYKYTALDYARTLPDSLNQKIIVQMLKNEQLFLHKNTQNYNLIMNDLSRNPASFFSLLPRDIIQYVLGPQIKSRQLSVMSDDKTAEISTSRTP